MLSHVQNASPDKSSLIRPLVEMARERRFVCFCCTESLLSFSRVIMPQKWGIIWGQFFSCELIDYFVLAFKYTKDNGINAS